MVTQSKSIDTLIQTAWLVKEGFKETTEGFVYSHNFNHVGFQVVFTGNLLQWTSIVITYENGVKKTQWLTEETLKLVPKTNLPKDFMASHNAIEQKYPQYSTDKYTYQDAIELKKLLQSLIDTVIPF